MPNTNYIAGDKIYSIPDEEKQDFLKDNPNAKEVNLYEANGKKYGIPDKDTLEFQKDFPTAKLLQEQHRPQKDASIPSFNPVENVTNAVKEKIKPPRDIYSNLTPSDNGNMPFVSIAKGNEDEQRKAEYELNKKVSNALKNPSPKPALEDEEAKRLNFNQTAKSVWTTLLTDPNAKDEKVRDLFYKKYEGQFDKDQIAKLKQVGDEAANLQIGYEQVRQQAHDNPNPENYSLLGRYQAAAGDMETAHKTFTYLMNTYPNRSEGYVGNAYLAYKHGDINGAIGFTNQALKANPDDVNALNERAKYETINKNPQNAAIDADKAVKNAKYGTDESVEAYRTRANVFKSLGKNDLAAKDEATANAMQQAIDNKEKEKKIFESGKDVFGSEQNIISRALSEKSNKPLTEKGQVNLNENGSVSYIDNNGEEKIIPADRVEKIRRQQQEQTDIQARKTATPLGKVGYKVLDYAVSAPTDIIEGTERFAKAGLNSMANPLEWKKNTLDALSGAVQAFFGAAKVLPSSAASMALWTGGTEVAQKGLEKAGFNKTAQLVGGQFYEAFKTPKTDEERELAGLIDNVVFLLSAHLAKVGVERTKEGIEAIGTGDYEGENEPQKGVKPVSVAPTLSPNITPDQSVESKLNDYKETNKKFLDNLKKRNLDQYNATIQSAKERFENEVKPKVTSEELKLKGVQDKIVNKQQLNPSDIEILHTFVNNLSPDEIKQAAQNMPEKPVEKVATNQTDEKTDETVAKTPVEKKPEINELDKAKSDLTRLQSRLGKAAENKKASIQKQIDAKNKQIEELSKSNEQNYVEKKVDTEEQEKYDNKKEEIQNNKLQLFDNYAIDNLTSARHSLHSTRFDDIFRDSKGFDKDIERIAENIRELNITGTEKELADKIESYSNLQGGDRKFRGEWEDIPEGEEQDKYEEDAREEINKEKEEINNLVEDYLGKLDEVWDNYELDDISDYRKNTYKSFKPSGYARARSLLGTGENNRSKPIRYESILDKEVKKSLGKTVKMVNPVPTVTPEVSEDGTINNRDNKGIEDALQKGEKVNPAYQKSEVYNVPLKDISKKVGEYQNRQKEYSEKTVKKIVEGYNANKMQPVKLFKAPDGKTYILSGHSRLEALTRLGHETIPAEYFEGTPEEAKEYARESNTFNDPETLTERGNYYRDLRKSIDPKTNKIYTENALIKKAKETEGKNWKDILSISNLNPKGKTLESLNSLSEVHGETQRQITKAAVWIGQAREAIPELTNAHEDELFNWLLNKGKTVGGKFVSNLGLISRIEDFIGRVQKIGDAIRMNPDEPLNLDQKITKGDAQISAENNLANLEKEKSDLLKEQKVSTSAKRIGEIDAIVNTLNTKIADARRAIKDAKEYDKTAVLSLFDTSIDKPEPIIRRSPILPKDQYIEGNDTDIQFSHDITKKGKNVLAPLGERHYINGKDNPKNFLAGAKRSRLVRPQPEGETQPEKLIQGETAHEGAPVNNWRNECIQGDGRLTRLANMTDAEKESYYDALKSHAKELGFTDKQIDEAKEKGYLLQRFINADHDTAAELSQKDERDLLTHDAADIAADKLKTLTPEQVDSFAHLFDGRPLEDILQNDGVKILHALNEAGVISDLNTERMKIGNTINPKFIPHLADVFRSVITGDMGNNEIPIRDYYNSLPDLVKHSLDRIIPDILKLPADKRPTEYFQKALLVSGLKGEAPTREFVEGLKNASDLDKAFIPFVLDPVSKHTIPDLMRDYKLTFEGVDYEGQPPLTMSDAMGHLFLETDNNDLNEKERETQNIERGTTAKSDSKSTSGKEVGTDINKNDSRTEGQKIVDKIFGAIAPIEKISELPSNISVTKNSVLGSLISGVRATFRRLTLQDHREAAHAIMEFHKNRTGRDKATNVYTVQMLRALSDADPETLKYSNKKKVYSHFDKLDQAKQPLVKAESEISDINDKIEQVENRKGIQSDNKKIQGLRKYNEAKKEAELADLHKQLEEATNKRDALQANYDQLANFEPENNAQAIIYDTVNGIKKRTDQMITELQSMVGKGSPLPQSYIDLVKQNMEGFLHRRVSVYQVPVDVARDRALRQEQIEDYKKGLLKKKDIKGGTRGLSQEGMAEAQVMPIYKGFLGNSSQELLHARKVLEATDEQGNKHVVEFRDGKIVEWKNGTPSEFGEYESLLNARKNGLDINGKHYTLNDGLVEDFNKHLQTHYEQDPTVSALDTYRALSEIHSTVTFFQSIRNAPEVTKFMKNLSDGQINLLNRVKEATVPIDGKIDKTKLHDLIDDFNSQNEEGKPIEYSDQENSNSLINKLMEANGLPKEFHNDYQAAKGIINHPIFDNSYFTKKSLETFKNALVDDKPKDNELVRGYLTTIYLGMEGGGHAVNLATNTAINNMAEIIGGNFAGLKESFVEAEKAIRTENELHKYFQSHGVTNFFNIDPDYHAEVAKTLLQNIEDNKEANKPLNDLLATTAGGLKKGYNIARDVGSKVNRSMIWWTNDMNAYQTILKEAANMGLDLKNIDLNNPNHTSILDKAIKESAKNYNTYSIASEELVGGKVGRGIASLLKNKGVFIFTNYLVGNLKMLHGQVEQIAKGGQEVAKGIKGREMDEDAVRRANTAIDRIVVGAALLYGIQKIEDLRNKDRKVDDMYHEENRPGILRLPYEAERYAKGEINIGELFSKIFHPMPLLMRFSNWQQNVNGVGGVNDIDGNIFSYDAGKELMLGASIPNVNQRTVGDFYEDYIKPRLGLEYDTKLTPAQHGLYTQLKNYNEYVKPEMDKMTIALKTRQQKLNLGHSLTEHDNIDEVGYQKFLDKVYNTSGNVMNHYEDYLNERIAELKNTTPDTEISQQDIDRWIHTYKNTLHKVENVKQKDKEAWEQYLKDKDDWAKPKGDLLKEEYNMGENLKNTGELFSKQFKYQEKTK
jgi:hypothetical protein